MQDRTHSLRWLLVFGAISSLSPLSFDLYLPALTTIAHDLAASTESMQQTVAVAMFGNALGMALYGPLSDRLGRRPVLFAALAAFALASLAAAFAANVLALLTLRLAQAFAVIAGRIVVQAMAADVLAGEALARMQVSLTLVSGVAILVGPLLGAGILHALGWRAIYVTLAILGLAGCALCAVLMPETRGAEVRAQSRLEPVWRAYAPIARNGAFLRIAIASALSGAVFPIYLMCAPSILIDGFGLSPTLFAVLLSVQACTLLGGRALSRALMRFASARRVFVVTQGVMLAIAGAAWVLSLFAPSPWTFLAPVYLTVLCFPMATALALPLAQDQARDRPGTATSAFACLSALIGGVAASLTSVFAANAAGVAFGMIVVSALGVAVTAARRA
ncbi:MAG: MFS transporter [Pseudomonadota bacterium]